VVEGIEEMDGGEDAGGVEEGAEEGVLESCLVRGRGHAYGSGYGNTEAGWLAHYIALHCVALRCLGFGSWGTKRKRARDGCDIPPYAEIERASTIHFGVEMV